MTAEPETQFTTARVTVQLEIRVSSNWGPDASIKQVHEQATADALGMIRCLSPQTAKRFADAVRVLGEPKTTAIIVTRDQSLSLHATQPTRAQFIMSDEQIKHMVDRFLSWKLPQNFLPDDGISFDPIMNKGQALKVAARQQAPIYSTQRKLMRWCVI